jgi:hypothetical protein
MDNENLKRIADALEEILRLVKKDMDRYGAFPGGPRDAAGQLCKKL